MTLAKALIKNLDEPGAKPIEVQFNPTEYTLTKGAQIAEIGVYGIDSPILQFIRGQNRKLTLDLFFDTTRGADGGDLVADARLGPNAEDVTSLTNPIYNLVKIQRATHAPPRVQFIWGSLDFTAIVENVQQKFELFSPTGKPLRATLSVTFREYRELKDMVAELSSPDYSKRYVVQRGDTLARIAAELYGDPQRWRAIAAANQKLESLRRLTPGTVLTIPALDAYGEPLIVHD
jgi:nucleoid-associated protein YgaU